MKTYLVALAGLLALSLTALSCGSDSLNPDVGSSCDPKDVLSCGTNYCSATTKSCVTRPSCTTNADCAGGFACSAGSCEVNCALLGEADHNKCAPDNVCNGTSWKCESTIGRTCSPETGAECNGTCDGATKKCVATVPCTTDEQCPGLFACSFVTKCKSSCTSDIDCKSGSTCDTAANVCK